MMRRLSAVGLLLLALVPACTHQATPDIEPGPGLQVDSVITIRVVNHSQLDATVYITHDGARYRLGSAIAASRVDFSVRTRALTSGEFALIADPVGSLRTTTSERLSYRQGSLFTWTLESDFAHNAVLVQE
jgi:hypothetical protein